MSIKIKSPPNPFYIYIMMWRRILQWWGGSIHIYISLEANSFRSSAYHGLSLILLKFHPMARIEPCDTM